MITPNMEALSLVELQYIARKQGVKGSEMMDRETLVEILEELFEDNGNSLPGEGSNFAPSNQRRFFNTLVEHANRSMGTLPGVVALPETYAQTAIHLMLKDPYWAHAYWDVCPTEINRLEQSEEPYSLVLRLTMLGSSSLSDDGESYDINVHKGDVSWNINLPKQGRTYKASLLCRTASGKEESLCHSNHITSPQCRWIERADELNRDPKLFKLLYSSIVTKGKVLLDCPLVQEMVTAMDAQRRG